MNLAIRDVKFFDVQNRNCPNEVRNEVKEMWANWELGNDFYFIKWDWSEMEEDYPKVAQYLRSQGLTDNDEVIIHWWW